MVLVQQRPFDDAFLVPKFQPKKKAKPVPVVPDVNAWFHVQKRLLASTRPEKLWRVFKDLKKFKWRNCGLAVQIPVVLTKRMGKGWVVRKATEDGISLPN